MNTGFRTRVVVGMCTVSLPAETLFLGDMVWFHCQRASQHQELVHCSLGGERCAVGVGVQATT